MAMNTVVIVFTSSQHHSLCWGTNIKKDTRPFKTGMYVTPQRYTKWAYPSKRVEQNVFIDIYQIEFKTGKTRLILDKKIKKKMNY